MAWSPVRRINAGLVRVEAPGDYATLNSYQLRDGTPPIFHLVCLTHSDVPKKLTATIKEDEVAGTLAYTDDDRGTIILNRCPN